MILSSASYFCEEPPVVFGNLASGQAHMSHRAAGILCLCSERGQYSFTKTNQNEFC